MILKWQLVRGESIIRKGQISARGFDEAAEDKLIPAHDEWLATDELQVFSQNAVWSYRVGGWRHPDYAKHLAYKAAENNYLRTLKRGNTKMNTTTTESKRAFLTGAVLRGAVLRGAEGLDRKILEIAETTKSGKE